jgi:hypothetical protein
MAKVKVIDSNNIEVNGKRYMAVIGECKDCAFSVSKPVFNTDSKCSYYDEDSVEFNPNCFSQGREDDTDIIWVEVINESDSYNLKYC